MPVYNGGPVEQDKLYFIHKIPELIPNSIEISNGIYWGGDFKEIPACFKKIKLRILKFVFSWATLVGVISN